MGIYEEKRKKATVFLNFAFSARLWLFSIIPHDGEIFITKIRKPQSILHSTIKVMLCLRHSDVLRRCRKVKRCLPFYHVRSTHHARRAHHRRSRHHLPRRGKHRSRTKKDSQRAVFFCLHTQTLIKFHDYFRGRVVKQISQNASKMGSEPVRLAFLL